MAATSRADRAATDSAGGRFLEWLFRWRDWFTFLIILLVFFSVVDSVNRADWVEGMPSLYPVALLGLLLAFFLARIALPEYLLHPIALVSGGAGMLAQVLALTPGDGFVDRSGEMVRRMDIWFHALVGGGISNDNYPIIVLAVFVTWAAAYISSWSVFRWNSAWLALVPGGVALLFHISYLPGQYSPAFLLFLLGSLLLIVRTHFSGRMREWRRTATAYPAWLHVFSTYQALIAAAMLLLGAWMIPVAQESGTLNSIWSPLTEPVVEKTTGFARVFAAANTRGELPLDRFGAFLPFRGFFGNSSDEVAEVKTTESGFLRAFVYDVYTGSGWRAGDRDKKPQNAEINDLARLIEEARAQYRQPATVEVRVERKMPLFLTIGDPLAVNAPAEVETLAGETDVISLRPEESLEPGDTYASVGLASVAPVESLQAAGDDYSEPIVERYLQLPNELPESVVTLAEDITRGDGTPYEKAVTVETFLRRYATDTEEAPPPSGEDAVEYFLFQRSHGHPLYHSTSMVVMLRTLGIPSRLATGFLLLPDAANAEGVYQVQMNNAFVWPEVYFPGLGWIPFSPSPQHPFPQRPETSPLPSGDATQPFDLLFEIFSPTVDGGPPQSSLSPSPSAASGGTSPLPAALIGLSCALAFVLASGLGFRYAWNRGLRGLSYPARVWQETSRLSSLAGFGRRPAQTPREFGRRLKEKVSDVADLPLLIDSYERAEYGGNSVDEDERLRLESLWRRLRKRLLWHALFRRRR